MKDLAKKVAWVTAMAVLAVGWIVLIDNLWPKPANSVVVCSDSNPCQHPTASKGKYRQFADGKIGKTTTEQIRNIIKEPAERKMKEAYRLYVIDQQQDPRTARQVPWPSPSEWFRNITSSVKCATVGASRSHWGTACTSESPAWVEKVNTAINESVRVTVKCGGAAVLGGVNADGERSIRRAFGVGVKGGWGMAGFGGACLWNEYYDRFQPW